MHLLLKTWWIRILVAERRTKVLIRCFISFVELIFRLNANAGLVVALSFCFKQDKLVGTSASCVFQSCSD